MKYWGGDIPDHWIDLISVHFIYSHPHSQLHTCMEELIRNVYNTRHPTTLLQENMDTGLLDL